MPYIHIQTNLPVSEAEQELLKTRMGQAVEALPGKSERWLMMRVEQECALWMAGTDEPAAMVQVFLYGGAPAQACETMTARICELLDGVLSLNPERIYVQYTETPNWGWNGGNL